MHGGIPIVRVPCASAADMTSQLMCQMNVSFRIASRPVQLAKEYFVFCAALFYIEMAA